MSVTESMGANGEMLLSCSSAGKEEVLDDVQLLSQ